MTLSLDLKQRACEKKGKEVQESLDSSGEWANKWQVNYLGVRYRKEN